VGEPFFPLTPFDQHLALQWPNQIVIMPNLPVALDMRANTPLRSNSASEVARLRRELCRARGEVFNYIERFYNRFSRHSNSTTSARFNSSSNG
jgi:hypothetical protein